MNVLDTLFGPLSQKYCFLFYYLMIGSVFIYSAIILFAIGWGISHSKGFGFYLVFAMFALMYGLMYFQTRLLYSMCVR